MNINTVLPKINTVLPGQGGSGYQGNWGPGDDGPLDRTYQIGGLGADARQIKRVRGPGYQHESPITSSPSSRAQTRLVTTGSLSTSGPTPTGGPPPDPQKIGPSGPSKFAAGVKGNFDAPAPHITPIPQWGETTGKALGNLGGAITDTGAVVSIAADSLSKVGMKLADVGMFATPMGRGASVAARLANTRVGRRGANWATNKIIRPQAAAQRPNIPTNPGVSPGGIILPKPGYTPKSTGNP